MHLRAHLAVHRKGVEVMEPFTHYVVKAHGNSRDVIVHLDVLVRSQLASEKGSPERR
jgi:hypothetical protein